MTGQTRASSTAAPPPAQTAQILSALTRSGLLLKQDKHLPSVVSMLAGEALAGSWWSHPRGRLIFRVLGELAEHPDILITKLLFAKDTLLHRSLWPAFLTVAMAQERWQLQGLSAPARELLERVRHAGAPILASGAPVRELAARLLVHVAPVHTAGGKHQLAVDSWSTWGERAGPLPHRAPAEARRELEAASRGLGAPLSALPWHAAKPPAADGRART